MAKAHSCILIFQLSFQRLVVHRETTQTDRQTHMYTHIHIHKNTQLKRREKISFTGKGKNNPNKNCYLGYLIIEKCSCEKIT